MHNFPTRWCTSTLLFTCSSVFGCYVSKLVDWERWSDSLSTTIAGYCHAWLLFLWGYVKDKVFSTPVPDITNLKARVTYAFATITEDMLENTWRKNEYRLDVLRATKGAHVEAYWCLVKRILELHLKKICLYFTYNSFLVINVCNQRKNLCSPCISIVLILFFLQAPINILIVFLEGKCCNAPYTEWMHNVFGNHTDKLRITYFNGKLLYNPLLSDWSFTNRFPTKLLRNCLVFRADWLEIAI